MEISRYGQSTIRLVSGYVALLAEPARKDSEESDAEIVLVSADTTDTSTLCPVDEGPRIINGTGSSNCRYAPATLRWWDTQAMGMRRKG